MSVVGGPQPATLLGCVWGVGNEARAGRQAGVLRQAGVRLYSSGFMGFRAAGQVQG